MARGFYWSRSINMPEAAASGEYGSIGWQSAGPVQTDSGTRFVDIVGVGTLDTAVGFTSDGASGLVYGGDGGVFFVTAHINLDNPEAEEAAVQLRLAVEGGEVARSTVTVIHSANSFDELTSAAQITLATGDTITAQVFNASGGELDLTSTYFRMQALRVG